MAGIPLESERLIEEERFDSYHPDNYYPVRFGDVLDSRYLVIGKLGYSELSTVWFCRHVKYGNYVAVKVCTRDSHRSGPILREIEFYQRIHSLGSQHSGRRFICDLLDSFELAGPKGQHMCLVHPPLHIGPAEVQYLGDDHELTDEQILQWTLYSILNALSFLHDEANVVYTHIDVNYLLLTIVDESLFRDYERAEAEHPILRKVIDDTRTIYSSREFNLPKNNLWGRPVLRNFGKVRFGEPHKGIIQPERHRAPEVLLGMEWNSAADIWNTIALIWHLLDFRSNTFNGFWGLYPDEEYVDSQDDEEEEDEDDDDDVEMDELEQKITRQVAEIAGYLGLPPPEITQRSVFSTRLFDEQGNWKQDCVRAIPELSFEHTLRCLPTEASRAQFLDIIRSTLRWDPAERKRATDLVTHPWLAGAVLDD